MNDTMHAEPETPPAISDDPVTHARDAVEAMRLAGADRPDIERALLGGAERHARFVEGFVLPEVEE